MYKIVKKKTKPRIKKLNNTTVMYINNIMYNI